MPSDLAIRPDRLPDFFVIGGPKCGTTSVFAWLRDHPQTYLPAKEPNFLSRDIFDTEYVPGALRTWDAYLDHLAPCDQAGKLTGESTPRYIYSDIALEVLATHPSAPRVIAILRNPIDLVFSLHGQMLRQGVELEEDFERAWTNAIAKGPDAAAWVNDDGLVDRRLDYPMFGSLGVRLQAYRQRLAEDQMLVLILEEDLTHNPQNSLAMILAFLGLPEADIDTARKNTRVDLRSVQMNRWLVAARTGVTRLKGVLGMDITAGGPRRGTGLMTLFLKLNRRETSGPTPKMTAQMRAKLATYFEADVAQVEAAMGRPIDAWKDWTAHQRAAE